jgi:hypothetical protein
VTSASDKPLTVRDHVAAIQRRMLAGYDSPMLAAEDLVEATALWSNVQVEQLAAEVEYNKFKLSCLEAHKTVSRAEMVAETSVEWVRLRQAQNTGKWLEEAIRTLKHYGNQQRAEMQLGGR